MKRNEFIRSDEFLIIEAAVDLGTVHFQLEIECGRTWSIEQVLEEVTQNDICHGVYRGGPEGFEDVSEELAAHCVREHDVIAQCQVPETWHWLMNSDSVQALPEDEIHIDPNAEHLRDYYASVI